MNKTISHIAFLGASVIATSAMAQDAPVDLGTIILSGGLTPIESDAYAGASSVISSQEIEQREKGYVSDILRTIPGVSVSRSGAAGGLTEIRLRGHENNHTLVLIDGVEVNSVDVGAYDFGGLLASDIERIEVLRGAQSSLYGSNAIGGVISITTKRAKEVGPYGEARIDVGSNGRSGGSLSYRHGFDKGDVSFSLAHRSSDGFDISGDGGEADGDQNSSFNFSGQYEFVEGVRAGATLRYADRATDSDQFNFGAATREGLVTDAQGSYDEVDEFSAGLFVEVDAFEGRLVNRVDFDTAQTDRISFANDAKSGDTSGRRNSFSYKGTLALDASTVDAARQTLTFAIEHETETYRENDPAVVFAPGQLARRERKQLSYVAEYQGRFDFGLDVQASVRFDDNDAFQDETTWALGLSYILPNGRTRLHSSAGTGVQNPTLIEQFGFFSDFQGNPDLTPEKSRSFDFGIEQSFAGGAGLVDLTFFRDELTNEITSSFDAATGLSRPVNASGRSDRQGVELTGSYDFANNLSVGLSYTYLDAKSPDGQVEVRRPRHDLSLSGTYELPNNRTSVTFGIQHVSGLFDSDFTSASLGANQIELEDYTVVDVSFQHALNDRVKLVGGISNLFDEGYEEQYGYAAPGREITIGMVAEF